MEEKEVVVCKGCGYLLGAGNNFCLFKAEFVNKSTYVKIINRFDVKGVVSAARQNVRNNCKNKKSIVPFYVFQIKRWISKKVRKELRSVKKSSKKER
ncbi:MAG: hypothetical protein WC516_06865 [Patescibacteria group bacterium]|jgi:hypothetical protein